MKVADKIVLIDEMINDGLDFTIKDYLETLELIKEFETICETKTKNE